MIYDINYGLTLLVRIVAGAIDTYIGLTGLLWWAAAIVIFLIINAIISRIKS